MRLATLSTERLAEVIDFVDFIAERELVRVAQSSSEQYCTHSGPTRPTPSMTGLIREGKRYQQHATKLIAGGKQRPAVVIASARYLAQDH